MRQKIKSYTSLKCSGFFLKKGPISRSNYGVLSPALLNDPASKLIVHSLARMKKSPSLTCIHTRSRHFILHYLFMQQIKAKKSGEPITTFPNGRHPYFLFTYYKSFQLISRLKGAALCLVKTKYAIKPKNPV